MKNRHKNVTYLKQFRKMNNKAFARFCAKKAVDNLYLTLPS